MFDSEKYRREIAELQLLGMTKNEALSFLFLLKSENPVIASTIAREVGMRRGVTYNALNSLYNQDIIFISATKPRKYFIPHLEPVANTLVQKYEEASKRRLAAASHLQNFISGFQRTTTVDTWFTLYAQIIRGKETFLNRSKNLVRRSKEVCIIGTAKDIDALFVGGVLDQLRCNCYLGLSHSTPDILEKYMKLKKIKTVSLPNEDELFFIVGDDELMIALDRLGYREYLGVAASSKIYRSGLDDREYSAVEISQNGYKKPPHEIRLLVTNSAPVISVFRGYFDDLYSRTVTKVK